LTDDDRVPADFRAIFRNLVIAAQPRYLERDAIDVYWEILGSLPIECLRLGALALAQSQTYFPSTGEWFQAAQEVQAAARAALADEPVDLAVIECEDCRDTGWRYHDGKAMAVRPCPCRATNRTYRRRQASIVRRGTVESK
jgi:hypothetical protein